MKFHLREFLNEKGHHSFAAIIASVVRSDSKEEGKRTSNTNLILSDCNKQISLTIDIVRHENRKNSIDKVSNLIKYLQEFEKVLIEEAEFQAKEEIIRIENQIKDLESKGSDKTEWDKNQVSILRETLKILKDD